MNTLVFKRYDADALRSKGLIVTENPEMGVAIVRYHKGDNAWKTQQFGDCDRDDPVVRNHRSVVYSLITGLPVSVAPIRRMMDTEVTLRSCKVSDWEVTKYYDGTMISVFWNPTMKPDVPGEELGWTLSSRSKLHAACRFTSDRLFRDLFEDARKSCGMEFTTLNREMGYTFILQHPESRHVLPVEGAKIVLVQVSRLVPCVDSEGENSLRAEILSVDERNIEARRIGVAVPESVYTTENDSLVDLFKYTMLPEQASQLQGWVAVPRKGGWERVRITSKAYDECLFLRGDNSNLRTNYIRLMAIDPAGSAIRQYAEWYPEEASAIMEVSDSIKRVADDLVTLYRARHVTKSMEHDDLPHWSRRPIWDLHGAYLRHRVPIQVPEVMVYFRSISPSAVNGILKMWKKESSRKEKEGGTTVVDGETECV